MCEDAELGFIVFFVCLFSIMTCGLNAHTEGHKKVFVVLFRCVVFLSRKWWR